MAGTGDDVTMEDLVAAAAEWQVVAAQRQVLEEQYAALSGPLELARNAEQVAYDKVLSLRKTLMKEK